MIPLPARQSQSETPPGHPLPIRPLSKEIQRIHRADRKAQLVAAGILGPPVEKRAAGGAEPALGAGAGLEVLERGGGRGEAVRGGGGVDGVGD
jgi:hypothetical protein